MSDSPTLQASVEDSEFAFQSLEGRDAIDFRLEKESRPSAEQLDGNIIRQLSHLIHHENHHHLEADQEKQSPVEPEPIYVGSGELIRVCKLIRYSG